MAQRASSPVFVGRRAELERLEHALEQAVHDNSSLVLVAGDAGVGKTRLISEFTRRATAGGARVLSGACLEVGEGGLPYAPFAEAFRQLAREAEPEARSLVEAAATAELARLAPEFHISEYPADSTPDARSPRARLFDGVLASLGTLSTIGPVVLILEDLHWADGSTRDLIRFLVRNVRNERLLFVATYRTDDVHRRHPLVPFLGELERSARVERIELRPFGRDDLARQVAAILESPPTADFIEMMLKRSDGLPFYVEELLAGRDADHAGVPPTLRDVLESRLSALTDTTLEIVRAASVIGSRFTHDRLAAVLDRRGGAIEAALREAIDAKMVVTLIDSDNPAYRFRHALIREAAHEDLLPSERVRLHTRLANYLGGLLDKPATDAGDGPGADTGASIVADLAIHAYEAHDLPLALSTSVRAARSSAEMLAYHEALGHAERALELWSRVQGPEGLTGTDRLSLLVEASRLAANAGRVDRALGFAQVALKDVDPVTEPDLLARLLTTIASYAWEVSEFETAVEAAERSRELIGQGVASATKARARIALGFMRFFGGRYREAEALLEEAIELTRKPDDRAARAVASAILSEVLVLLGRPGRALALAIEADAELRTQETTHWSVLESVDWTAVLYTHFASGEFEAAVRDGYERLATAMRYGVDDRYGGYLREGIIESLKELGRYDELEALAATGGPRDTDRPSTSWILDHRSVASIRRGRVDQARELIDRRTQRHDQDIVWPLIPTIELARAEGRFEDVEAATVRAVETTRSAGILDALWLILDTAVGAAADEAEAARRKRRPDQAMRAASLAREWSELLEGIAAAAENDGGAGPFLRARAATAAAEVMRAEMTSNPERWADAASQWSTLPAPYQAAYCRFRQAEALLSGRAASSDRSAAQGALRAALVSARALGAGPLQADIESLARRGRIELEAEVADAVEPPEPQDRVAASTITLTPRERETLRLVAAGHTNREIGDQLYISEKTVSVHVSNAMAKLQALSRYEAAAAAEREGLLA